MRGKTERVAIVTGGGSGIGKAIAEVFAIDSSVMIIGRDESKLKAAVEELGPRVIWQRADVSRREDVVDAVEAVIRQFGRIDVLVNNAGFVRGITTEMQLEEAEAIWDEVVATNLKGAFLMVMAAARYLRRPGGRVINISSIAAFTGGSRPGAIPYAAAKAGILGLTYSLARELSPQGITVNAIAPGFIADTGFTGQWPEERVRSIIAQTPAGRAGDASDIAAAVRFLASEEASFITGEVINVNGGWLFGH